MADPEAAVAIVRASRPEESILLIRRTEREADSWSGHWSFPGGRRDPEDPDLLHTALRELEEECGIRLSREQTAEVLPPMVARRRVGCFLTVAPYLFHVDDELPAVLNPQEAASALWAPLKLLSDPTQHRLTSVPGLPKEMAFPAIDLNGLPLWGFTYRLITNWLGLVPRQCAIEQAGFEVACLLVEFLISHGLALRHGWQNRDTTKVAEVEGVIPVELVLRQFSAPGAHVSGINLLEVRPDYIRLAGLAFEEYFIYGSRPDNFFSRYN